MVRDKLPQVKQGKRRRKRGCLLGATQRVRGGAQEATQEPVPNATSQGRTCLHINGTVSPAPEASPLSQGVQTSPPAGAA